MLRYINLLAINNSFMYCSVFIISVKRASLLGVLDPALLQMLATT